MVKLRLKSLAWGKVRSCPFFVAVHFIQDNILLLVYDVTIDNEPHKE